MANRFVRQGAESGNAMVECALIMSLAIPVLFGVVSLGLQLGRGIEAVQVTRDAGHMYTLGADFSAAGSQAILSKIASGFDLTADGDSVLIFSRIVKVYQADCDAAAVTCTNLNKTVFSQRIVIGKASLRSSSFGTPPAQYINSAGNIAPTDYYRQASLEASGFDSVIPLHRGDVAWMVEGYFSMPNLSFLNPNNSPGGYYARFVF